MKSGLQNKMAGTDYRLFQNKPLTLNDIQNQRKNQDRNKSYFLTDGKPGIYYFDEDTGLFCICYSMIHKIEPYPADIIDFVILCRNQQLYLNNNVAPIYCPMVYGYIDSATKARAAVIAVSKAGGNYQSALKVFSRFNIKI